MPYRLDTHVLTVDANVIHKVDTANPQNLFSMWTVFSRCADSVEQGRRLENLSWRLWNRETLCCDAAPENAPSTTLPKDIPSDSRIPDVPQLSGSVDSVASEEAVEFTSVSAPVEIVRPRIRRQDSCASSKSRGRDRHITSDNFEKMVVSIITQKEPLTAPLPEISSPFMGPEKEAPAHSPSEFERAGSTTPESPSKSSDEPSESSQQPSSPELTSRTMVVRGFSPSRMPIPRSVARPPSVSPPTIPEPQAVPVAKVVQPKKPTFTIGASYSSSEQDQSVDSRNIALPSKQKMFQVGGSSEDSSLKSALHSVRQNPLLTAQKKQTSFSDHVTTRTFSDQVGANDQSETEGDYMDESAIDDDDDSSDWEDSVEDSGKSSIDDKTFFQRVDSKANLPSRRSLITLMIEKSERQKKLGNGASQSTSAIHRTRVAPSDLTLAGSPNDSDDNNHLMMKAARQVPLKPITEVPRSVAQPIVAPTHSIHHQAALSPRTTRRNMLATELTESLRRHLLWERQQKSSTANAVLKRRHTSQDVANLKQYPEKSYMSKNEDGNGNTWNQYFNKEASNGYHSKGW